MLSICLFSYLLSFYSLYIPDFALHGKTTDQRENFIYQIEKVNYFKCLISDESLSTKMLCFSIREKIEKEAEKATRDHVNTLPKACIGAKYNCRDGNPRPVMTALVGICLTMALSLMGVNSRKSMLRFSISTV